MKQFPPILFLIFLAIFLMVSPATAADLITSRAVLEDTTGSLTINDVAKLEFAPIGTVLNKGYTKSVHWLRLQVKAPPKGKEVVLVIPQTFLNEIRIYEVDGGSPSGWKNRVTGNHYPYTERDRVRNPLGFVVNIAGSEATFYLRLKTRSKSLMIMEAVTPDEAEQKDDRKDLLEVFYVTSMLALLLWAIHGYLLARQTVVGVFAICQAVYIIYGIAITGYFAPYNPAGFPLLVDWVTAILYCSLNFVTPLFNRELFKLYEPPPLLMRGFNLFLMVFPVQLLLMIFGYTPLAITINFWLFRVSWLYYIIVAFALRREQSPSRRILQGTFIALPLLSMALQSPVFYKLFAFSNLNGMQSTIADGLIRGGVVVLILHVLSRCQLLEGRQSALELKAKSEFLAMVSHEIRTPLNALVGFSSLARKTADPVKLNQYHTIIEQSSRSLMELVNDILDMSKFEAGRMEIDPIPFNLRQLVENLVAQYRPLATQNKLAFRFDSSDTVPTWVMGDVVRLRQILSNLLSNALKFTGDGSVSFTVSTSGQSVRFQVQDTGIGIPKEKQKQLFQSFHQLDASISRRYGGSGLGLVIVKNLVEMMKGSISVESQEGAGSSFIVELPFQETEPVAEIALPAAILGAHTILVIEDNKFNRQLLEEILTSWGQQVTSTENSLDALQLMEQQHFDLVLLDIRMPDIDGIEVARRVREREREHSLPAVTLIAITADADAVTRDACLAVGINAVLAKPVDHTRLAAVIASYGKAGGEDSRVKFLLNARTSGDLSNNPERARQYRELLLQDIDGELEFMRAVLESEERDELGRIAHSLKGLCGHLASREPLDLSIWLHHNAVAAPIDQLRSVAEELRVNLTENRHDP